MVEHLTVKVTLTVEVDGHTLTFEETEEVEGPHLGGLRPPLGYSDGDTLESNIRGTIDTCGDEAAKRSVAFLSGDYPVSDEGIR